MNHHHQHHGQLKLQEQLLLEQQHQQQYSTNTPISSSDDLDEDEEEDEEEEDEEDEDDFPSKFLQTTHRKPVNIYEADMDLSDQLRNHNQNQQNNLNTTTSNPLIGSTGSINNNHLPNPNYQLQPSSHHHQQPLEPNLSPIDHPAPPIGYNHSNLPSTTRPGTHSLTPPGTNTPQPDQPPIIPFQNTSTAHPQSSPTNLPQPTEVSKDFHRHLGPIPPSLLEPPHSNSNNNNNITTSTTIIIIIRNSIPATIAQTLISRPITRRSSSSNNNSTSTSSNSFNNTLQPAYRLVAEKPAGATDIALTHAPQSTP
ncbi:hypothetical protein PGTUg99_000660 [Puccinia graminis f. sp. tritici]|uniref:Uncharacterized protein n=1 Tax=Puccinia graminis f. sp. tritici TaxID=56615 RepID=A0A5B0RX69_PUCGR|nr:hypothetical protein PGTUg99_000660 [Puccinia graminis f. sp. tritici]